ncbi:hypothetical protein HAX54_014378, partial [Datura stramonium]|nr:hypothetical protein [Datura stramonium]
MASRADKGKEIVAVPRGGSKGSGRELHQARQLKRHPLLGGLDPRLWGSMGLSGSMFKKKP